MEPGRFTGAPHHAARRLWSFARADQRIHALAAAGLQRDIRLRIDRAVGHRESELRVAAGREPARDRAGFCQSGDLWIEYGSVKWPDRTQQPVLPDPGGRL